MATEKQALANLSHKTIYNKKLPPPNPKNKPDYRNSRPNPHNQVTLHPRALTTLKGANTNKPNYRNSRPNHYKQNTPSLYWQLSAPNPPPQISLIFYQDNGTIRIVPAISVQKQNGDLK